jgi:hypothetical protein
LICIFTYTIEGCTALAAPIELLGAAKAAHPKKYISTNKTKFVLFKIIINFESLFL